MRTSIRPDELAGLGRLHEEFYVCDLGVGFILLADDLPLALELPQTKASPPPGGRSGDRWAAALERYFAGERISFDLNLDAYAAAHGLTQFERDVHAALAGVPYGSVISYRELAGLAGRPQAYRAVGSIMARNALPVILPCHRVIRNDGRLGEYGDDPLWKERLLVLEGVHVSEGRVV